MNRERFFGVVTLGSLALVLIVAHWRLFVGEAFFWGLPSLQFVPWRAYAVDALWSGHLPLWNPYSGAGAPLFANYQSGLLYPLNWSTFLVPDPVWLGWLMSILALVHLFLGGWGMWRFTDGMPALSRGVSALSFALASYSVARIGTYPIISAVAWLPWLLWAVRSLIVGGGRRAIGYVALFTGFLLTAGHAQTAWYVLLLAGAYALWVVIRHQRRVWYRAGFALFAVILGMGAAGLQLAATAELTLNSQRSTGFGAEEEALNFSYASLRTMNLLAPNVFGNPGDGSYLSDEIGVFWEYAVYVGLIPLMGAFAALFNLFRRDEDAPAYQKDAQFWALVVVVGFVFALGNNTPVFLFLYRNVPTFDMFQAPVRWHLWTVTGLSLLAGVGVTHWGSGKWVIFWTRLASAGAVGAIILALIAPNFLPPETLEIKGVQVLIQAVIMTAIWGFLAGLLTLLKAEAVPDRFQPLPDGWGVAWGAAVLVVVALDLGWAARGLNPTVPASFYAPSESLSEARAYWPQDVLEQAQFGQPAEEGEGEDEETAEDPSIEPYLRINDYRIAANDWHAYRNSGLPNLNVLDERPLLNNFEPLQVGVFADYIDLVEGSADGDEILLSAAVEQVFTIVDEARIEVVQLDTTTRVRVEQGSVMSIVDTQNSVEIQLQKVSGQLVLADTYFPGWTAQVDGQPADIVPHQGAFRAIDVPDGTQTVRFAYHPVWLWPGVGVSLVSLVVILLLLLLPQRSRSSLE